MTEINSISAAPAGSRGTKARRLSARIAWETSERVTGLAFGVFLLAFVGGVVNKYSGALPVYDDVTGTDMGIFFLALWGGAKVLEALADEFAEWINPDARDGDLLFAVAAQIEQVTSDVRQGADYDDVRLALQSSNLTPGLYALATVLRDEYAREGEMEEASALSDTAALARAVAISLGHRDA
ncbi:hypothetical protein [Streptomyces violarus]|uniref:hypothetical protein n=1 Tax=Streptomyces violarus TaxID=67380 RepID=UPI0021BF93DC|nr:hypothetical protein [Streptomyces violarus]MCT9142421.1 hypothetical protein [Streptomyces violarus]